MVDYIAARVAQVFLVSITVVVFVDALINGVY